MTPSWTEAFGSKHHRLGGELEPEEDAVGQAMLDYLETGEGEEIVERDDAYHHDQRVPA